MAGSPPQESLLRDLVETRLETPEVEYKRWMPLTEPAERAAIAKHICALANSGGGYLIFGFEDDGTPSEPRPTSLKAYDQDAVNAIADRYLTPAPHCEVRLVTASTGAVYPVVRVPSHGEQPICAQRDGPTEKGRPVGIVAGVHYVRAPGPKSVPITTPELWRPVIRRCVFAERAALLSSIGQLFDGRQPTSESSDASPLSDFMAAILSDWDELGSSDWPAALQQHRIAFAFRLLDEKGKELKPLPIARLHEALRTASFAAAEDVPDGSSAFEHRWQEGKRPFVTVIGAEEGYQALILPSSDDRYAQPTLWRVAASGRGGDVVGFPEDNPWVQEAVEQRSSRRWPPTGLFAPLFQARHIAQHVAFVARLAAAFPSAASAELAVDYLGLEGRMIGDPRTSVYFSLDRKSSVNARRVSTTARVDILIADIDDVTADLVGPITRLFDGWDVNADAVAKLLEPSQ